jgi:hypothetical protein
MVSSFDTSLVHWALDGSAEFLPRKGSVPDYVWDGINTQSPRSWGVRRPLPPGLSKRCRFDTEFWPDPGSARMFRGGSILVLPPCRVLPRSICGVALPAQRPRGPLQARSREAI